MKKVVLKKRRGHSQTNSVEKIESSVTVDSLTFPVLGGVVFVVSKETGS